MPDTLNDKIEEIIVCACNGRVDVPEASLWILEEVTKALNAIGVDMRKVHLEEVEYESSS